MIYRLIELERLQRALEKYYHIAETFFDVPKPMPPIYRKGGVNMEREHNYGPKALQTAEPYWAELLGQYNDSNDPIKHWRDNDGWHGEVKSFGFYIRVTCRYENGQGHMVSLWQSPECGEGQGHKIISDEPEEEIM